jgi:Domain of unknown function (DUF4184)
MKLKKDEQKTVEPNSVFSNMPFTPAHPAILLLLKPFKKLQLSWTAMFIGSIIPDFEYFIWMSPSAYVSHTILGIFIFNLPMTFIIAFVWHQLLYPIIIPRIIFFHQRIQLEERPAFIEWMKNNWRVFILSATVGIITHLLWDSFSHANGYLVHRVPFLLEFIQLGNFSVRACYVMWYISTIIGMTTMVLWYVNIRKLFSLSTWRIFFAGNSYWGKILFTAGLIGTTRIYFGLGWNWARHLIMIVIGSLFYAVILVSWLEIRKSNQE